MAVKFYPLLHRLLSTLWPWLSWLWEPSPGRCGGDMAEIIVTWRHSQGTLAGYNSVTCGERKLLAMRSEFLSTCWMKRVLCALAAAGAGFILKHAVTSTFCPIKNVRRTQLIFIAAGKWLLLTRYGKFSLKNLRTRHSILVSPVFTGTFPQHRVGPRLGECCRNFLPVAVASYLALLCSISGYLSSGKLILLLSLRHRDFSILSIKISSFSTISKTGQCIKKIWDLIQLRKYQLPLC